MILSGVDLHFILLIGRMRACVPVGISLGLSTLVTMVLTTNLDVITIPQYCFRGLDSFPLMAIPFFITAGLLMNYTGTLDSQFTLAHEMGHAIHSYLSNRTQNPIDAGYVIFVAEVASTCNEALLMEHLLSKTTDKKERAYLINHFLEQFKSTLYRQAMFAEFELNIGRMAKEGQTLTADVLSAEYRRLNEMYFGPDMVIDEEIALEWARIPHFYYNYYVFQYATGYSAAIALSRRILREGESAVQDYLGFLSGGCSKSPIDLLKGAGVDMTSPEPVNQALELFGELLDEMEQLMQD